jgi:GT2 family glycosyltransferase
MVKTDAGAVSTPAISVCIVTARRSPQLRRCLASLLEQIEAPPWELLVSANGDAAVADEVKSSFPNAVVRFTPRANPGQARNLVVPLARGELLLFLDDDVVAHPNLLERLHALAEEHKETSVFGGPNLTPQGSSRFQVVQGAVLGSFVTSGPVRRRYGQHPAAKADERFFILCNLAVRRSAMMPFEDDLVCAEENRLLTELGRRGGAMLYDPSLIVYHERRSDLPGFTRQLFKYGKGRGQVMARDPHSIRLPHLAPALLLVYLSTLPFTALLEPALLWGAGLYLAALIANGAAIALTLKRATALPIGVALTALVHTVYGAGIWAGVVRKPADHSQARRVTEPSSSEDVEVAAE